MCNFSCLYLPQGYNALLRTHTTTLDHDKVIVDFTIMRETTHGGYRLLRQIIFSRGIILDDLAILGVDPFKEREISIKYIVKIVYVGTLETNCIP